MIFIIFDVQNKFFMLKIIRWSLIWILLLGVTLTNCKKDPLPEPEREKEDIPEASDVNKFIWEGLATYYYYVDNVPSLVNPKFNNEDSLNLFLNNYKDSEELFYSLLYRYGEVDKWSFIVDDYKEIEDWISGINESMGFDFRLSYIPGSNSDLFGYVRYVLKGSPADKAGIKRGDFFVKVDGTQLTLSNYQELLFSNNTYTLHMADNINQTFSENDIKHTLTAEVIQENPVHLDTILNLDKLKVGYLVYNSFTSAYDKKLGTSYDLLLNDVFSDFKTAGIDKLILDLRYNGGGSVLTTQYLASMIHSTDKTKVLATTKYNDLLQNYFSQEYGENYFYDYFTESISSKVWKIRDNNGNVIEEVETMEASISSLNFNELYVITSNQTASASELLINGLEPYINVRTIGGSTAGKNVGSFTIRDWIDDEGNVNPNHTWAMQPITLKIANSEGYSEYINGLPPDIEAYEITSDNYTLLPLGDKEETLLKAVINDIKGETTKSASKRNNLKILELPKKHDPLGQEMYINSSRLFKIGTNELLK
jgi:C-terminal processing protease CtpA/Prc